MDDSDDAIKLKAVNHVTYNVTNKEHALKFWEEILGVKEIPKQVDIDHLVWIQLPSGTMVHLVENPDSPSKPQHHAAFEVDDIAAAAQSFEAKGVKTTPIITRNDGQRMFNIEDPDGNRIEICTKSGFGILV